MSTINDMEPLFLSVSELAERWGQTTRQILEISLEALLPILFPFDGLAIDFNEQWLAGHGAHMEESELKQKQEFVIRWEALIKRNAAGLTGNFERMNSQEVADLRREIIKATQRIALLTAVLEKREHDRRKYEFKGYVRSLPGTIWEIMLEKETAFPLRAMQADSPVHLLEIDGKTHWDGAIIRLESGRSGRWQSTLHLDNLVIPMPSIKALEANNPQAQKKPARAVPKSLIQDEAILDTLRELGHDPKALPPRPPGAPWVKAQAQRKLESRKDLFTPKTFNTTWERLRSSGELIELPPEKRGERDS